MAHKGSILSRHYTYDDAGNPIDSQVPQTTAESAAKTTTRRLGSHPRCISVVVDALVAVKARPSGGLYSPRRKKRASLTRRFATTSLTFAELRQMSLEMFSATSSETWQIVNRSAVPGTRSLWA
jgi:hypothetical protein